LQVCTFKWVESAWNIVGLVEILKEDQEVASTNDVMFYKFTEILHFYEPHRSLLKHHERHSEVERVCVGILTQSKELYELNGSSETLKIHFGGTLFDSPPSAQKSPIKLGPQSQIGVLISFKVTSSMSGWRKKGFLRGVPNVICI
jgi:hypothetical protein